MAKMMMLAALAGAALTLTGLATGNAALTGLGIPVLFVSVGALAHV